MTGSLTIANKVRADCAPNGINKTAPSAVDSLENASHRDNVILVPKFDAFTDRYFSRTGALVF